MKRYPLFLVLLITLSVIPFGFNHSASAQDGGANDVILLNDATPGIDVIVNPSAETTGVVALEMSDASVFITDAQGNLIFEAMNADLKGLEFRFAPNAGAHTITIERLPNAVEGYVRIQALSELMTLGTTELVSSSNLNPNQEADFPLNADNPSSMVNLTIPSDEMQTISASFPGAPVTVQLVNSDAGTALATLSGSFVDGVRFTLSAGNYQMTMLNNNTSRPTVATVALTPALKNDFTPTIVADSNVSTSNPVADTAACGMLVNVSAANVRSGPGDGYSVLGYAFRGNDLIVGGINPESGWLLVQTETGETGWLADDTGLVNGACDNLVAYDIPYLDATSPALVVQQTGYYDDDDEYEEEEYEDDDDDDEHEEDEHEEHDD